MATDRPTWTQPGIGTALARAFRRRCPRCGGGDVFDTWIRLKDDCPTCALHFERVDGYWLGSMVINLAVTQVLLLGTLIGLLVATWPDVPWTAVLMAVVAIAVVIPLLMHPLSRLLWVAGERHFHLRAHPDATD
ncbi:MAG: DUF983 domain-containing protein [Acidimicrobiia bacterium]|nr:DUF983 domain-containing protein [Acidimicrobiia bacterium]